MDLHISVDGNGHPVLTWAAMQESDVNPSGSILVERRRKNTGMAWMAWTNLATIAGSSTSYIDQTIQAGSGNDSLQYKIRAKDTQPKYSSYSDVVGENYNRFIQKIAGPPADIPLASALQQNYPNPFNPTTTIKYDLSEDAHVTLMVCDVLGKEVAVLVDEIQEAGSREVSFDASRLATGIYFYRLTAGPFTDVKKLVVVK
jgi:hypothetical protein